jgi:hypothetical protein
MPRANARTSKGLGPLAPINNTKANLTWRSREATSTRDSLQVAARERARGWGPLLQ